MPPDASTAFGANSACQPLTAAVFVRSLRTGSNGCIIAQGQGVVNGANSDLSCPIESGISPACRALTSPIEMATGKQAYFCGKPNPLMMRTGLRLLNCHSADAVMVGDRMDTDVISGLESGMSTVLVLSGVTSEAEIRTYAYKPTVVLNGVGDIVKMAVSAKKNKE